MEQFDVLNHGNSFKLLEYGSSNMFLFKSSYFHTFGTFHLSRTSQNVKKIAFDFGLQNNHDFQKI